MIPGSVPHVAPQPRYSEPHKGPVSAYPILSRGLAAKPAASAAQMCGRTSTGIGSRELAKRITSARSAYRCCTRAPCRGRGTQWPNGATSSGRRAVPLPLSSLGPPKTASRMLECRPAPKDPPGNRSSSTRVSNIAQAAMPFQIRFRSRSAAETSLGAAAELVHPTWSPC
jgi:hypothetical protein